MRPRALPRASMSRTTSAVGTLFACSSRELRSSAPTSARAISGACGRSIRLLRCEINSPTNCPRSLPSFESRSTRRKASAARRSWSAEVVSRSASGTTLPSSSRTIAERGELVQQALGVAEGAAALAGYDRERLRLYSYALGLRYLGELLPQGLYAGPAEVEALAAAYDGGEHLLLLGGRRDEDHVLRRLLQHLQEGVKGLGGQHVDLVYDVDLHPAGHRSQVHPVPEVPDLVYPAV